MSKYFIYFVQVAGGTSSVSRMCGVFWNAATAQTTHATACTFAAPFKIGVHFDADEAIAATVASPNYDSLENNAVTNTVSGVGYNGFYFNYWQNSC